MALNKSGDDDDDDDDDDYYNNLVPSRLQGVRWGVALYNASMGRCATSNTQ